METYETAITCEKFIYNEISLIITSIFCLLSLIFINFDDIYEIKYVCLKLRRVANVGVNGFCYFHWHYSTYSGIYIKGKPHKETTVADAR